MFSKSYKSQAAMFGAAALALTVSASSHAAFNLVANGDFESGGDSWALEAAGGSSFSYEATGGNPDGYARMDNTSAVWGGIFISPDDPAGTPLGDLGLTAGTAHDFSFDMACFSGTCANGGIKLESWSETGVISDTGDIFFASDANWTTYTTNYTIAAGATRVKIVLLGIDNNSVYGFDNVGVEGAAVIPVPAAAWLFGSALAGLVAVRRRK